MLPLVPRGLSPPAFSTRASTAFPFWEVVPPPHIFLGLPHLTLVSSCAKSPPSVSNPRSFVIRIIRGALSLGGTPPERSGGVALAAATCSTKVADLGLADVSFGTAFLTSSTLTGGVVGLGGVRGLKMALSSSGTCLRGGNAKFKCTTPAFKRCHLRPRKSLQSSAPFRGTFCIQRRLTNSNSFCSRQCCSAWVNSQRTTLVTDHQRETFGAQHGLGEEKARPYTSCEDRRRLNQ